MTGRATGEGTGRGSEAGEAGRGDTGSRAPAAPAPARRWADLGPRVASGVVMAGGGLLLIWAGGVWFATLAVVATAIMIWELAQMQAPDRPNEALAYGIGAGAVIAAVLYTHDPFLLPLIGLPPLLGLLLRRKDRLIFAAYAAAIMTAGYGLVAFREGYGVVWLAWLVIVVVVTDIAGYFAGKSIGGPKFWPRVSPKKTWAGIVAGWIAAALVGFAFRQFTTAGPDLPWISAALSLASQMGDIAESAIKRHAGVKDSSRLIPGHGGLLDRFDGLLGAALFMLFVAQVVVVPVVRF